MTLSIIILSWNTKELTRQCLRSIFNNVNDLDFEVIVIDNASSDGSAEMIEKEFPQTKLIKNSENLGFTKGNNQGFKESRGNYILFLNSDTIIPPPDPLSVIPAQAGIHKRINDKNERLDPRLREDDKKENRTDKSQLYKMVETMKADPQIGALTPKLVNPDGSFQWEFYRKIPNLTRTFWVYLVPFGKLTHKIGFLRKRYLVDIDESRSQALEDTNAPGAAFLMRRQAHEKIGGRDENIFYWMEDVDLWFSLKKAGYKIYYLSDAKIVHYGAASSAMWDDLRKMLDFRTGYVYVFRKHKGKFKGFIAKWMFILNALLIAPLLLIMGFFKRKYLKKGLVALKFAWIFSRA